MIDDEIITKLKELDGEVNFGSLLTFMIENKIPYKNRTIKGFGMGLSTADGVILDLEKISKYHPKLLFYVILHETGHYKRIAKMGRNKLIQFLSEEDFEVFFEHVVNEEIIADRYSCLFYRIFNGENFPRVATQQLEDPTRREKYRGPARTLYGTVKNTEESYNELIKSFIDED